MEAADSPRMMDAEEVASRLGVRKHRVYELTRRDILPHVRLGRQLRYDRQAIEEFIAAGGTASNTPSAEEE